MVRVWIIGGLCLLLLSGAGCGDSGSFRPAQPPATAEELEGLWKEGGPVARVVGGHVPVLESDLELLRRFAPDTPDEELVRQIALRRLLARRAVEQGLASAFDVVFAFRRALAQRYLTRLFREEHSPDSVPMEVWEGIYRNRDVYPLFDHKDTYFVVDVQMICCEGNAEMCASDPSVQYCLQDSEPDTWEIYEDLKHKAFDAPGKVKKYVKKELQERYAVRTQEYGFQYDFSLPHEEQKGYKVVNRKVAVAARDARLGEVTKPVSSNFGWHILYVKEYLPEIHQEFGDPEVLATLKKRFYMAVRRQDALSYLEGLFQSADVTIDPDAIRELDWAKVTGLK